jgi:serine/threonine protein kinase/CRP-like cAMP-binding protein
VRALTAAQLWFIDRGTFRAVIAHASHSQHVKVKSSLRKGLLEDLSEEQLDRVAAAATTVKYHKGDQIIKKGEEGEVFYIIESGAVICMNLPGDQSNNVLHEGDYFGERALLKKEPRAADVYAASETVTLIAVHREDFEALLGHLRDLLEYNLGMRLLLCVPILSQLADAERTELFAALRLVNAQNGQVVIARGVPSTQMFIVKEGSVCVRVGAEDSEVLEQQEQQQQQEQATRQRSISGSSRSGSHSRFPSMSNMREAEGAFAASGKMVSVLLPGHWFPSDADISSGQPSPFSYVALGQRKERDAGSGLYRTIGSTGNLLDSTNSVITGPTVLFTLDRDVYLRIIAPITRAHAAQGKTQWLGDTVGKLEHSIERARKASLSLSRGNRGSIGSSGMQRTQSSNQLARKESAGTLLRNEDTGDRQQLRSGASGQLSKKSSSGSLRAKDARDAPASAGTPTGGAPVVVGTPTSSNSASSLFAVNPRRRLGIPFRELEQRSTLGTGTFGRVRLVFHRKSGKVYALKMLQKKQIVALKQQANIMNEKEILWRIDHPFIIKLYDTFKDQDRLYMLLELVQGGELFSRLQNSPTPGRIAPHEARFYAACVLDAFDSLHSQYIIYRDLKPENLLIDSDGYLKLVDFGFAKVVKDRAYTLCGTPEYLAPELVLGRGHDKGVDYWALGILLFEQVAGYSPFADRASNDQMVICRNILRGEVEFPAHFKDKDLRDLILKLLVKDIPRRLGCLKGGATDIKSHRFFAAVDWERLRSKSIPAPWRPRLSNPLDTSNFDPYDENDVVEPFRTNDDGWDASF